LRKSDKPPALLELEFVALEIELVELEDLLELTALDATEVVADELLEVIVVSVIALVDELKQTL